MHCITVGRERGDCWTLNRVIEWKILQIQMPIQILVVFKITNLCFRVHIDNIVFGDRTTGNIFTVILQLVK